MSLKNLINKMNQLRRENQPIKAALVTMQAVTAQRIFTEGKDKNNDQIGEYSEGYLKTRVREGYPNSKKVILQATRQMVNDWSVINQDNQIGLGFKNPANGDKSFWVEDTYSKEIFDFSNEELKLNEKVINDETTKFLRNA